MRICILYGGVSSEREVSLNTGKSIYNAIKNEYDVVLYDFNGNYNLMMKCVSTVDLVFVALHGGDGENGTMQKFLEGHLASCFANESRDATFRGWKARGGNVHGMAAQSICLGMIESARNNSRVPLSFKKYVTKTKINKVLAKKQGK